MKMKKMLYLVLIFAMIISLGCATKSVTPNAKSTEPAAVSSSGTKELPKSYAPTEQSNNKARQVASVYGQIEAFKTIQSFSPVILKNVNESSSFAGALLTRCDFDVIKALVAAGWTPVVIIRSPTGQKHLRTVLGYNDGPGELILADPMEKTEVRQLKMSYSDFDKTWDDPQKTCLLILPQYISEQLIKDKLLKYIPSEKLTSVTIKSKVQ
jgi:hypothetical protein